MITMQEPYARAVQAEIERDVDGRLVIDQLVRSSTLRARIGRGLIGVGLLLVGEASFPEAA